MHKPIPKALLVGIQLPDMTEQDTTASLQELQRLVHTLGFETVGTISQKRSGTRSALVVGEGKLQELAQWTGGPGFVAPQVKRKKSKAAERFAVAEGGANDEADEDNHSGEANNVDEYHDVYEEDNLSFVSQDRNPGDNISENPPPRPEQRATMLIFDTELSPSQLRNLESAAGVEVLDRTGVIIEIFSRHARTRAARLQVEIARLKYLAPRIRETGQSAERMGGKGAGESSQELDRRHIRDRIKELKTELEGVQNEGQLRRHRRYDENSVALVGYTNAGKSSLMRALTGSEILVADKLFATLDTTVRPLQPDIVPRVLVSDTVGFIKKLPHDLVASFHSTLEEALHADLLLYVVDAADPTFREQLAVTQSVLGEIGATAHPSFMILNKRDKLSEEEAAKLQNEFPEAVLLSTRNRGDVATLGEQLRAFFERDMQELVITVPYDAKGAIGEIRRQTRVLKEDYSEMGVALKIRGRAEDLARLKARFKL